MERDENGYDTVGKINPSLQSVASNTQTGSQRLKTYQPLDLQSQNSSSFYSTINSGASKIGHRKEKKKASLRVKQALLCNFVLLSTVLSMAAVAMAIVSIITITRQTEEYKGQVESLREQFFGNMNTCRNNGTLFATVEGWSNTSNCTMSYTCMKLCP